MDFGKINEIFSMLTDNLTPLLLLLTAILSIVEKSQKLSNLTPITNFFKWLERKMNSETLRQIEEMKNNQEEIKKVQDASSKTVEEIKLEQENLSERISDIQNRQLADEAYSLNDFYQRHISGDELTREQYELAINMFEKHLAVGANSVNRLHLEVLKEYYIRTWVDVE